MAENEKDLRKRLEQERQITETMSKRVLSAQDYAQMMADVGENYEKQLKLKKQIDILQEKGTEESLAQAEIHKTNLEHLQNQNKILAKQMTSWKNLGKSVGNMAEGVMSSLLDKYFAMDEAVRKTTTSMGMNANTSRAIEASMMSIASTTEEWGVGVADLATGQAAYSEALGRNVVLSEQAQINMAETSRATGMAYGEMAGLAGEMEAFGLGANDSVDTIWEISQIAEKMGVNQGKVLKKFQANLGLLNQLDFKGGMTGMAKMAAYSEKFKISMQSVASVADKVFRPEGAVEAAAQLQALGGSLAKLGDPFQLMYKARYAPEELAKSLTEAATASAVFNEKTGEFEVNALELDRLREAGKALGMDYTELVQIAKTSSRIKFFEKGLVGKGLDPEQVDKLTTLATMKDGVATITVDGNPKALDALSGKDLAKVLTDKAAKDKVAEAAMSAREQLQAAQNQIIAALMPALNGIVTWLKEGGIDYFKAAVNGLVAFIKDWGGTIVGFLIGAAVLSKSIKILGAVSKGWSFVKGLFGKGIWFKQGVSMRQGFDKGGTTKPGGGATGKQSGKFKDAKQLKAGRKVSGQSGVISKSGKKLSPKQIKAGFGGKAAKDAALGGQSGAKGKSPAGMTKGLKMNDVLKGAAAILILAAALFVFAKALQEFDKLQNGWETLALAAGGLLILGGALFMISKIPKKDLLAGALAIGVLGISLIPFAYAMSLMEGISWTTLGVAAVALVVFSAAMFALGALMFTGVGALLFGAGILAFIALGGALAIFGLGLQQVVEPIKDFSSSMSTMANLDFSKVVGGIMQVGAAIEGLDSSSLRDFNETVSTLSDISNKPIKIEFGEIKGSLDINGLNGGGTKMDISHPSVVDKIRDLIFDSAESDRNGGKLVG